jgi:3-oxoacyl-[acyl-carrier protein] reductase
VKTGLTDKVILITGASRNIGRATALAFAEEGSRIVLTTRRSKDSLDATAAACAELGAKVTTMLCDVTNEDEVGTTVAAAQREFGSLDVLVNNATQRVQGPFLEQSPEDWRGAIAVNLDGPYYTSRAVLPGMIEAGWGRIINYSGGSAFRGGGATKAAVKLGVVGFTRGLAREFGKHGITVNSIAPGTIEVERDAGMEREADIAGKVDPKTPVQRFGRPDEVAGLVIYIASDQAAYITGHTFHINGGDYFQ